MSDDRLVAQLRAACTGEVSAGATIADLTTLRVGGPARVLVEAENDEDIAAVGAAAAEHGVGWLVVGRGSNLLVADEGWGGIALKLGRGFRGLEVLDSGDVRLGAAEPLPVVAVKLANEGLTGFEFAAAVPGSIGGAVRMNAGAHGSEMADVLVAAEVVTPQDGHRHRLAASQLGLSYRHSELPPGGVVVAAELALRRADAATIRAAIDEIKQWRREHQPINEPNCGSVFTNPEGDSAGRLVDAAGLKGTVVGGARISQRHANFIVTEPEATAADVTALIRRVRIEVAERFGIDLIPEVVTVGVDVGEEGPS
ncbi:MAG: UDP-N-acetylmuramate dehydrogenase [Actinobacteria bacterium]|nr:UDP-N-acetylmuramate dehydrogenase [Actinomycetota bacterium]